MKMKLATQIILALSIVILLSLVDSYTNYILSQKVETNSKFLSKSESIIRNSNKLHKTMIEMQGAFRGYLLTDDSTFLENYNLGLKEVPILYEEQKKLIETNLQQNLILDSIIMMHNIWLHYANELIAAKQSTFINNNSHGEYQNLFETKLKKQVGKKINDRIKVKFAEFDKSEYAFRNNHAQSLKKSIENTHRSSIIFLSLTFIVGIGSSIYIVSLILKRIAVMVQLAGDIAKGKFRTMEDTRNDELTSLSTSLNTMSENLGKTMTDLENRNMELNKFAYVVSHDLKAPVRGIRNVVKWIEEDFGSSMTKEMKEYLDIIPDRTKRMEDLINGLLNYATISDKSVEEDIDLNVLVQEIVKYIVPRDITVMVDMLPKVHGERIKLEQVFTNLISNAVNFTKGPQRYIKISCTEKLSVYEFSVKDNGIGIPPEFHDKIFELFQTLRQSNEKESTGIGLAIVKKIIEEQGGKIYVVSIAGEGSEFIFTWPI